MDATALRAMQAPIKERYKGDPGAAMITLKAKGTLDDQNIACKVETGRALAVASITKGGTIVVVGLFGGDVTVPTPYLPLRAMTLRGSYVGSQTDIAELLELVNRTGMPPVPIRTRPLDEVNATLNDLRAGKIVGRVVLTPAA